MYQIELEKDELNKWSETYWCDAYKKLSRDTFLMLAILLDRQPDKKIEIHHSDEVRFRKAEVITEDCLSVRTYRLVEGE
jgi:hypothetical protein